MRRLHALKRVSLNDERFDCSAPVSSRLNTEREESEGPSVSSPRPSSGGGGERESGLEL